jgi:hypothetical protein
MPLKVEYLDERRGVLAEASGELTGDELLTGMDDVNSLDLADRPILYTFFDFNGVTSVNISTTQIRAAADLAIRGSRYQSVGRVVAIYAKNDLHFALARMWEVLVNQTGWETYVFRERSDALAWIGERVSEKFGILVTLNAE